MEETLEDTLEFCIMTTWDEGRLEDDEYGLTLITTKKVFSLLKEMWYAHPDTTIDNFLGKIEDILTAKVSR